MVGQLALVFGFSGLLIDGVWLSMMVPRFYQHYLGHLLSPQPNLLAAGLFYILYSLGVAYFVLEPACSVKDVVPLTVMKKAFFFGVVAYGTYDLTNQATLMNWPWIVTIVDMLWGGFFTALTSRLTLYFILGL